MLARCKRCKTIEEGIEHCSGGKDIGEIRYFVFSVYMGKLVEREYGDFFLHTRAIEFPSTWMIIASRAMGRRPPEIVVQPK